MKTLFERLSKEHQDKLDNYEYISLKDTVRQSLKKEYISELTVKEFILICDVFEMPEDLNELRQLFNNN